MSAPLSAAPLSSRPFLRILLSAHGWIAWLALAVSIMLSVVVTLILREQQHLAAAKQFQLYAQEVEMALTSRLKHHEQILLGGAGLFGASEQVTRENWRYYVERLQLQHNYPGIQGVGFTKIVKPDELATHIDSIRAQGFPDYTLRPPGEREIYTAIIYLEPFTERNLAAFGFDMYSEPVRRRTMDRAINTGGTSITGKVRLVQETHGREQAGFLMYVPVYQQGMALETPEQRWRALNGFVYSPYRVDDLMQGILGTSHSTFHLTIHNGVEVIPESLMYDSSVHQDLPAEALPVFSDTRTLTAYGNTWTVSLHSLPTFTAQFLSPLRWLMPVLGVIVSGLLFTLILTLLSRREQALTLATELDVRVRERTAELHTTTELLQKVLSSATEFSIIATDTTGVITVFNKGAENLLGYSASEMVGTQTPAPLHLAEEVAARSAELSKMFGQPIEGFRVFVELAEREGSETREWTYIHKSGRPIKVSLVVSPMINKEGKLTGYLGIAEDITERLAAERASAEQAQHTQTILDNMIDGLITIDTAGNIQSFNPAATRIFGYTSEEILGRNVSTLMPNPHREAHDGYLRNFQTTRVARIIGIGREVDGLRRDGSLFPMELAVSEIRRQGQPLYVGMVRDITERKRVEQMKNEFVSTVSHELRTPLTSISGALGLIKGDVAGHISQPLIKLVDVAFKNCQRLSDLINDLLDMDKLLAGKMEVELTAQALVPLLQQAVEANQLYANQYQVNISLLLADSDNILVSVNEARFIQVMANLLSNAAKFSPQGARVDVSVVKENKAVRIKVRDYGEGIPEAFHNNVFQKFCQADSSDSRKKGGTGLGLAITRELVLLMHGDIGFTTSKEGTEFYITLPAANTKMLQCHKTETE